MSKPVRLLVVGVVLCVLAAPESEAGESAAKPLISSMTVFPITMLGKQNKDVGEVVGLMLEKNGLRNVAMAETPFAPPADATLDDLVTQFGAWIRAHPIATGHALYGEYAGTRATGVRMVRGIIVDKEGKSVWASVQKPGDEMFDSVKPGNPMACCVLLSKCVLPLLVLKPWVEGEEPGPMARLWARKSGTPTKAESAAMEKRQAALKKAGATARITVYPLRLGKKVDAEGAATLVKMINDAGLCTAVAAPEGPCLDVKPDRNEMKVLWDMAGKFRDHVRKNPPETPYALYADYMVSPRDGRVMAVHFAICDAKGEWVVVDMQNSHHEDFQAVAPKHVEGCNRLVLKRLERYLK